MLGIQQMILPSIAILILIFIIIHFGKKAPKKIREAGVEGYKEIRKFKEEIKDVNKEISEAGKNINTA